MPRVGLRLPGRCREAAAPRPPADVGVGHIGLERRQLLGFGVLGPHPCGTAEVGDPRVGRDTGTGENDDPPAGADDDAGPVHRLLEIHATIVPSGTPGHRAIASDRGPVVVPAAAFPQLRPGVVGRPRVQRGLVDADGRPRIRRHGPHPRAAVDRPGGGGRLPAHGVARPRGGSAGRPARPPALAHRHHSGRGLLRRRPGCPGRRRPCATSGAGRRGLPGRGGGGGRLSDLSGHAARPGTPRRPPRPPCRCPRPSSIWVGSSGRPWPASSSWSGPTPGPSP